MPFFTLSWDTCICNQCFLMIIGKMVVPLGWYPYVHGTPGCFGSTFSSKKRRSKRGAGGTDGKHRTDPVDHYGVSGSGGSELWIWTVRLFRSDPKSFVLLLMAEILHQLRLVIFPIIYRVSYIPGGARFQPSTVGGCCLKFISYFLNPGDGEDDSQFEIICFSSGLVRFHHQVKG